MRSLANPCQLPVYLSGSAWLPYDLVGASMRFPRPLTILEAALGDLTTMGVLACAPLTTSKAPM